MRRTPSPRAELAGCFLTLALLQVCGMSGARTKCLRDIILDKRGPLTKALDKVKAVCEKCGAEKEWNAYEDYMLACLYNQADAYDQKQPITIPAHNQICGALNITRRWESHRNVVKNLIREIDEISETIKKKQQRTTKQQWHAVAVSVLRAERRKKKSRQEGASRDRSDAPALLQQPLPNLNPCTPSHQAGSSGAHATASTSGNRGYWDAARDEWTAQQSLGRIVTIPGQMSQAGGMRNVYFPVARWE
ncbi:hypothetical protein RHOSPDRAFT_27203 [Rhodotorula sp. JG-1b]|nr:hypothetical protein RHOSPDRAFT_27203 [Rhodotorula sp. JG-1b]